MVWRHEPGQDTAIRSTFLEFYMPHYADGTEAKVGDVVKGTGYNLVDADGKPRVFVGTVVGVTPGSEVCNIQVAHVVATPVAKEEYLAIAKLYQHFVQKGVIGCGQDGGVGDTDRVVASVGLEYGQCDQFVKIGNDHRELFMSVRTTADERLDKADDHIGDAIKTLGDIVIEKCYGHDEYCQEYEDAIRSVYIQLIELRAKLNR